MSTARNSQARSCTSCGAYPPSFPRRGTLPPLYYGTIDATPLWICLLCDAVDAGMPDNELAPFLPHLERALAWMRDSGDSDGDGLLEYIDESGRGLANQGWKDSGDSVRWADGRIAIGPIALCEVQGYAYEAAVRGGALLERFGREARAGKRGPRRSRRDSTRATGSTIPRAPTPPSPSTVRSGPSMG